VRENIKLSKTLTGKLTIKFSTNDSGKLSFGDAFRGAVSRPAMACNVVAASRGCGIRYTSQRATNGKNSKYFQTTVVPQSCETARCMSVAATRGTLSYFRF